MVRGKGIAIFALIIGILGLGLGIISVALPRGQNSGIQKTWFVYDSGVHFTNPTYTDIPINTTTINFTVKSGESVYGLFNTHATLVDIGLATIKFKFVLDGYVISSPVSPETIISSDNQEMSVSVTLQMATDTILPGFHTATISIQGNFLNNAIDESTLLIQTYLP